MTKFKIKTEFTPHGSFSWEHSGSDAQWCEAGETVRLLWVNDAKWGIQEAHYTDGEGNVTNIDVTPSIVEFEMPAKDITIGGTFKRFVVQSWTEGKKDDINTAEPMVFMQGDNGEPQAETLDQLADVFVDDELSAESERPVQNKVVTAALALKQALLEAGVNIKTINGASILGAGNLSVGGTDAGLAALGFEMFDATKDYAVNDIVVNSDELWIFTAAHEAGDWTGEDAEVTSLVDLIATGKIVITANAGAVDNLKSWLSALQNTEDVQTVNVFTAGGDTSIDSSVDAILESIVAKEDFTAADLLSTGFNLLRNATQVGTGWYFEVPAMVFTALASAETVNGVLFTKDDHTNLTPTVYFKPLGSGVPESVTDGTACAYTDAGGYRFFTCDEPGYLIVSDIDRDETCAHLGWSGRYDEYIAVDDATDAGATIALTAAITALHAFAMMLAVGNTADRIDRINATQVRLTANCDRVKPTWTNTPDDPDNPTSYTHTATISGMKPDGAAAFMNAAIELTIDGTNVSYVDSNASASDDYVKYEKETPTVSTFNLSTAFPVEDWGVIALQGATGSAFVTVTYAQGIPDNLRALVSGVLDTKLLVIAAAIVMLQQQVDGILNGIENGFPKLKTQQLTVVRRLDMYLAEGNAVVNGAGAPSILPEFNGQEYFDTTNKVWYKAAYTGTAPTASAWKQITNA